MPKGKLTSKYDYLLDDSDFRRWYENVKRGSVVTAHHWLRRIGYVHAKFGKSPKDVANLDQKQATAFLFDIVSAFEKEAKNGGYIANFVKPLKSWLEFNGITIQQRIKIPGRGGLARVADERPSRVVLACSEVEMPLSHLSHCARMIGMLAHADLLGP